MKLFKKKAFLSLLLIFTLLFFNINSVFATSSHLKTEDEFIVDLVMVDEMINSLTDQELNDNPYLSAVIGDMKKIVKEEENITLSKLKSRLYMKDSYKNHQKSKFQSLHENEKKAMTQEDKEQLERVDKLAKKYYDYYIEHGTFPKESKGEVQILSLGSFVTILKGIGLTFTESGLATRLAALGVVAAIDGPLPIGDFIALVGAAVIIGGYAVDYVRSTTTSTAIANNIAINEGVTYKDQATKSLTQTRTITYPTNSTKHWAAAPRNDWGGGVYILQPLTYSQAVLRALSLQDTYSLTTTDARSVAQGGSGTGYSPVHDNPHYYNQSGVYMYPNNKPHWHCIVYGTRVPGHHWYG